MTDEQKRADRLFALRKLARESNLANRVGEVPVKDVLDYGRSWDRCYLCDEPLLEPRFGESLCLRCSDEQSFNSRTR